MGHARHHAFDPGRLDPLPPQQQRALEYLQSVVAATGKFPSRMEIAAHMGWKNESSVSDCLARLHWRGKIKAEIIEPKKRRRLGRYERIWTLT